MTRTTFPTMFSLLLILTIFVYTQNVAAGACGSTDHEEMKRAAVYKVLHSLDCDSYYCGKLILKIFCSISIIIF